MEMTVEESKKSCQPVAWNPTSPATLMIPSAGAQSSSGTPGARQMYTFLSHDGVGCNTYETSALMELLDSRDEYLRSETVGNLQDIRSASRSYRMALEECVQGWRGKLTEQEADINETNKEAYQKDMDNFEVLQNAYAVTHLSETFLLTPANDNFMMEYYENSFNQPGAITADMIRYLRLHHLGDPQSYLSDEILQEIEQSHQPDQIDGGEPYWKLVEDYVLRGCLEDAWALLSRHSICRRAMESITVQGLDEYQAASLEEDRNGFRALETLLLSAPLPGGRTDLYDTGFEAEPDDGGEQVLLQGVRPSAYRLWETSSSIRQSGDYPVNFQINAAMGPYQSWQEAVLGLEEVKTLSRRIPQLRPLLRALVGNFDNIEFDSWAHEFCAELLYRNPKLRLQDMHGRAALFMKKFDSKGVFDKVLLSIMKGNAGSVIKALHELGGGSGAALPAVITSLLCDLLDDAKVLPAASRDYSLKLELLKNASFAIRSSFSMEGHADIGTRLTVRLLLPHVTVDGDVSIAATLANTLEHHYPQTDAEADAILDLCRKLVERKNIRVLDGCISICLARYQHFLSDQRPGGAIYWLLKGMDLEQLVLCGGPKRSGAWQRELSTGVCYRLLTTYCTETTHGLLKGIRGAAEGGSLLYFRGTEIIAAVQESEIAGFIPAVKLLEHVVTMAGAIPEGKDDAIIGGGIIACLEARPNEEDDGVVSSLAHPSMHWDLIRLAKSILDRNSETGRIEELHLYTAAFDVRGMQVLLETLTTMLATLEMEGRSPIPDHEIQSIRLAFAEGLMRAFVAENASKKLASRRTHRISVAGLHAADLAQVSREKQELVVKSMLDF